MKPVQLDLLSWRPSAEVVVFPPKRMRYAIESAATEMVIADRRREGRVLAKRSAEFERWLRQSLGLPESQIRRVIHAYRQAVLAEAWRLRSLGQSQRQEAEREDAEWALL